MNLLFSMQWLPSSLIQSLGWTLIHSLWLGMLASLVALFILWITRKKSPVLRYNLLLFVLSAFTVSVIATFIIQTNHHVKPTSEVSTVVNNHQQISEEKTSSPIFEKTKNYLSDFEYFFNNHAELTVAFWFIIFCIQTLRLFAGMGYIYRIRYYKTFSVPKDWQIKCEQFRLQSGIQRHVSLIESAIVKIPVVVGYFKPMILLPVGLLANLPYNQVESILLHELAHIKRRDYLVNLLQSFVETVFFFNPAILWISSQIREEREACCDEIAVRHTSSKSQYIESLVSFQEYSMEASVYAMAFPGRKNFLLKRVKRMLSNENKKLGSIEKAILLCGCIAVITISMLLTQDSNAQTKIPAPLINQVSASNTDTIPKNKKPKKKYVHTRVSTDNSDGEKSIDIEAIDTEGNVIIAKKINDELKEITINEKVIEEAEIENYIPEINEILEQELKEKSVIVQKMQRQQIEDQVQAQKKQQANMQQQQKVESQLQRVDSIKKQQNQHQIQSQKRIEQMKEVQSQQEIVARIQSKVQVENTPPDSDAQAEEIISFLKDKNIIEGRNGTVFLLNNTGLTVNGKKQPEEIHKVLKEKYLKTAGDSFSFSSSGGSTTITVQHTD